MQSVQSITLLANTREELLPDFSPEFPYIATRAELEQYTVPWHWHPAVELFYMESGTLEYQTPRGNWVFPAGSGGFVNSNVLHCSHVLRSENDTIQRLHLFDPILLSGGHSTRMETAYILPLTISGPEVIPLFPDNPEHSPILSQIQQAFSIQPLPGYEFQIRETLAQIWLQLLPLAQTTANRRISDQQIKTMMVYIHEHYRESIDVQQLADLVHVSKRSCFRLFREQLHTTPVDYMRDYRLQKACQLLRQTDVPITEIGYACGLGSASYFTRQFRDFFGCTPAQYRRLARS